MKKNQIIIISIVVILVILIGITIFFVIDKNNNEEDISNLMFQNETAKIELFDVTDKTISAKISLTGNTKNLKFESNLKIQEIPEIKENITEYYLTLLLENNSHGKAALKITADNISDVEKEIEY